MKKHVCVPTERHYFADRLTCVSFRDSLPPSAHVVFRMELFLPTESAMSISSFSPFLTTFFIHYLSLHQWLVLYSYIKII